MKKNEQSIKTKDGEKAERERALSESAPLYMKATRSEAEEKTKEW